MNLSVGLPVDHPLGLLSGGIGGGPEGHTHTHRMSGVYRVCGDGQILAAAAVDNVVVDMDEGQKEGGKGGRKEGRGNGGMRKGRRPRSDRNAQKQIAE